MKKQRLSLGCLSLAILFLVMAFNQTSSIAQAGSLDGKTFVGKVGENGKKKGDKDELIFKDGRFRSTACDEYGFGDAPYTTAVNGDATTFEATTVSAKEGKMEWRGTVKGNALDGTFTWYPIGKDPVEYWVKAQLKK